MNTIRLGKRTSRKRTRRASDERGMVSILVTMVLMIVISLIVLGFAQISRRNQRTTLDQQLSTQAFYAAESGVNDVAKLINSTLAAGGSVYDKPTCAAPTDPSAAAFYTNLPSSTISASNNVSYSCLIVDTTPPNLPYSDVNGTDSTIIPLADASGAALSTVTFAWQTKTGSTTPTTGCPTGTSKVFSTTSAWTASGCGYGVFRLDLVPTSGGALTAANLASSTMTVFVVPTKTGSSSLAFAPNTSNSNDVLAGSCTDSKCSLTITGLSATQYYARVMSLYEDVSLNVTDTISGGGAGSFAGAQTLIDATGKAQDVLRRIQVSVSNTQSGSSNTTPNASNALPDDALESTTSICKRFATMQNYFSNNATTNDGSGNQLCQ